MMRSNTAACDGLMATQQAPLSGSHARGEQSSVQHASLRVDDVLVNCIESLGHSDELHVSHVHIPRAHQGLWRRLTPWCSTRWLQVSEFMWGRDEEKFAPGASALSGAPFNLVMVSAAPLTRQLHTSNWRIFSRPRSILPRSAQRRGVRVGLIHERSARH